MKEAPAPGVATGVCPVIGPAAVALLQLALIKPAIEFSSSRAIRNSEHLIADVEKYHAAHGRYPPSLMSVWEDYRPLVIGIREFQYETSGNAYNLFFDQLTSPLATRESVMYNPLDQQVMTSHAVDLLRLPPEELGRHRGFYVVHDLPQPHWKCFWFD